MTNIQKIIPSKIVDYAPDDEIRRGAKYFGCSDEILNLRESHRINESAILENSKILKVAVYRISIEN